MRAQWRVHGHFYSPGKCVMCGKFLQTHFNYRTHTESTWPAQIGAPRCATAPVSLPFPVKCAEREGEGGRKRYIIDVFPWSCPSSPRRRLTLRWKKSFKIFFLWDNIRRVCLGEPIKSLPCYRSAPIIQSTKSGRLTQAAAARLDPVVFNSLTTFFF